MVALSVSSVQQQNRNHKRYDDRSDYPPDCGRIGVGLPVRRMHPALIPSAAGVENPAARDPDRPGNAALPDRDVGAADSDAQAGPGLREVDREAGEDVDAAIEAEAAHCRQDLRW